MEIAALDAKDGMSAGAELWVLPESQFSKWNGQIDWQLNFQITRAGLHQSKSLSENVQNLLNQCELENLDWVETKAERLLIYTAKNLPAKWALVLGGADQFEQWLNDAVEVWKSLAFPNLRFFLPQGEDQSSFEKKWAKATKGINIEKIITVVVDSEPQVSNSKNG